METPIDNEGNPLFFARVFELNGRWHIVDDTSAQARTEVA